MPTPAQYNFHLDFVNRVLQMHTGGFSHPDSMKQLPFPGNCVNWNVGHLLVFRAQYLGAIDGVTFPDAGEWSIYGAGSDPLTDSTKAIPFDKLLSRFSESTAQVKHVLQTLPVERLDEPYESIRGTTLGDYLQFYIIVHESYHLGQLAILREFILS
ncbi:MAG: DinB family protein [Chloroflexota bacterium]